jgi:uncharacterized membrane protein YfcA
MLTTLPVLILLITGVAFLYASVGFGGATGYLAVMSFFSFPPLEMASTALLLNIIVSGIAFISFLREGHLNPRLLLPFLAGSIPAALLGGAWRVHEEIYFILLYAVLTFAMLRMLFGSRQKAEQKALRTPPWLLSLLVGGLIGLLSGIVGIGGGIILSPLIILAGWGTPHQAAAVSAAFIFFNSLSGVAGRVIGGNFVATELTLWLLPFGILAALAGSTLGARRLSSLRLQRLLGVVMLIAVVNYWGKWFS